MKRTWLPGMVMGALLSMTAAADTERARQLIDQGQAQQAYELLLTQEWELAGDPGFDYLLGVAALNSGRPAEATLAFERVLAVQPQHMGALMDMGLAYQQLGDLERAREAFTQVEQNDPPPLVRELLKQHLDATSPVGSWSGSSHAELQLGYDDNVNNSGDRSSIYVPLFDANLVMDASNVKQGDSFARLGLDGSWQYQHSASGFVRASLNASSLSLADQHDFQTRAAGGSLGIGEQHRDHRWEIGVLGNRTWLDDNPHHHQLALFASWRDLTSPRRVVDYYARATRVRYDGALGINDNNQFLLGSRLLLAPSGSSRVASLGVFAGYEDAINGRADGNRKLLGFSAGLQGKLTNRLSAYTSGSLSLSNYQGRNAAFLKTREDRQGALKAGLSWELDRRTHIGTELSFTRNTSNIAIYDYDRLAGGLKLRRDFQ